MTVKELQGFTNQTRTLVEKEKNLKQFLKEFEEDLHPTSIIPTNTQKTYLHLHMLSSILHDLIDTRMVSIRQRILSLSSWKLLQE